MNFRPELAAKIIAGEKTVTRRLVSDNPRSPWSREGCALKAGQDYAVCPGRGKHAIGRVVVRQVRLEQLGWLTDDEATRGVPRHVGLRGCVRRDQPSLRPVGLGLARRIRGEAMRRLKSVPWIEVASIIVGLAGCFVLVVAYVTDDRISLATALALFAMSYALDAKAELRKRAVRAVVTPQPVLRRGGGVRASGWSYYPDRHKPGVWHWSAYGPRGRDRGSAKSSLEARSLATRSAEDLRRG